MQRLSVWVALRTLKIDLYSTFASSKVNSLRIPLSRRLLRKVRGFVTNVHKVNKDESRTSNALYPEALLS